MSLSSIKPTNAQWFRRLLSGEPHQVIGGRDTPYMLRWYVVPRNPLFNVYVHKFLRDDDDRALHDHPWWFVSLILRGGYLEWSESADGRDTVKIRTSLVDVRSPFWRRAIAFRPAEYRHRVALPHTPDGGRVPAWTLILTGRRVRTWGFWCKSTTTLGETRSRQYNVHNERFVKWDEFGDAGCGEFA